MISIENSLAQKNKGTNEVIYKILKKKPEKRLEQELEMVSYMLKENPFFKKNKLRPNDYEELAQLLTLKHYKGQDNIMEFGDKGDEFFIILQGLVNI